VSWVRITALEAVKYHESHNDSVAAQVVVLELVCVEVRRSA